MKGFALVFAAVLLFPASLSGVSLENGILKVDVDDDSGRIFLSAIGIAGGAGDNSAEGAAIGIAGGAGDNSAAGAAIGIAGGSGIDAAAGAEAGSGAGSAAGYSAAADGGPTAMRAQPLLFHDTPPSSYTVVSFADGSAIFGSTEGRFTENPRSKDGEIVCVWETDTLRTTQAVSFIGRSGMQDGILVRYVIKNIDGREFPAGISVVLDTILSEDSGAHFLLSDGRSVDGLLELSGEEMPYFWSTGADGGACLVGALRGSTATSPDRALFANYRYIRERIAPTPLGSAFAKLEGFSYGAYSRNDSAVALVFAPEPLAAEREYRIVIGVCGEGEFGGTKTAVESVPGAHKEESPDAPTPPPPSVAGYLAPAPLKGGEPEKGAREMPDAMDTIDDLIEEIDRLVEQLHLRMKDGSVSTKAPPPGEEEMRKLKERLEEIEGKTGEAK